MQCKQKSRPHSYHRNALKFKVTIKQTRGYITNKHKINEPNLHSNIKTFFLKRRGVRTPVPLCSSSYLKVTSKERCTFCLGNCSDLLKRQQVMDINVIFCFKQNSNYFSMFNTLSSPLIHTNYCSLWLHKKKNLLEKIRL